MEPVEIRPWRNSPFVAGAEYRVRHDFTALRDTFRAGEVLTYTRDAYNRYDSVTGYFFSQRDAERLRVWDVPDDEDLDVSQERFEPVKLTDTH